MESMNNTNPSILAFQQGESHHLPDVFEAYRGRLRATLRLRIRAQLTARIDPSDVLQEAFIQADRRVNEYLKQPKVSPFIWLRGMVFDQLKKAQRVHLGAQRRSVERQVDFALPEGKSCEFVASVTSPSQKLAKSELLEIMEQSIGDLKETDQEIILMRYFEGLSNSEIAQVLGLPEPTATMRHVRAITRLKNQLLSRLGETEGDK